MARKASYLQKSRVVLMDSSRKLAIQCKVTNNIVWSRTTRLNELGGTTQHSLEWKGQASYSFACLIAASMPFMTTQTLKLPLKRQTWTGSQPTSRYNHNEYRDASELKVVSNPAWSRYEGDIHDIRHPCGDRFWTISELAWYRKYTASRDHNPSTVMVLGMYMEDQSTMSTHTLVSFGRTFNYIRTKSYW